MNVVRAIIQDAESHMKKTCEAFRHELGALRVGRATPALVEKVQVECYGSVMPLEQVANISAPEPRLLVLQPWDRSVIGHIEKALLKADLGMTPTNDGNVLRLVVPQLTEERRKDLVRQLHRQAEESKVALRNLRRDAIDRLRAGHKNGEWPEDEVHRGQDEIQKLTDRYVQELEQIAAAKEREILEV